MKKTLLFALVLALFVPWSTRAQIADYVFSTSTTTYTSIANADSLLSSVNGDGGSQTVALPFSFSFGETVYPAGSLLTVRADGYVYLGTTSPGHYANNAWTSTTNYSLITALLAGDGKITADSARSGAYKALLMEAGSPVLVIEFKSAMSYSASYGDYNYQIRLYPNGVISAVYGQSTATSASGMVHNFFIMNGSGDKKCITGTWDAPVAGIPSALPHIAGVPASGTVFTYTPPACRMPGLAISSIAPTEATVSITAGAEEDTWLYSLDNSSWNSTSTSSLSLSGLTPDSVYTLWVRSFCSVGDTGRASSISFRTHCLPYESDSIPWLYGFEDATGTTATSTFNSCMGRHVIGSTTNFPYPTGTKHSGSKGLYMYGSSSAQSWVTLPLFETDLNQLMLSFYAYGSSTSNGYWAVGIMTDPDDITTFDTIATGQGNSSWTLEEVPLSSYSGTGTYLAILCPMGSSAYYTSIDDIRLDYLPACFRPQRVVASNLTPTSATITIADSNNNGSYMLYYVKSNDTIYDSIEVSGLTQELTELVPATTYNVAVRSICSDGTMTSPVYTSFFTPCQNISQYPWNENFGSINDLNQFVCWNRYTGLYNDSAAFSLSPTSSGWIWRDASGLEHSPHVKLNIYGTSCKYWLMTPVFELSGNLQLTFDYSLTHYNNDNPRDNDTGDDDRFIVFLVTADTTFVPLAKWGSDSLRDDYSYRAISNGTNTISIPLDDYDGQTVRFAFYGESTVSGGDNDMHVGNIYVAEATECPQPSAAWATEITVDGATINWTDTNALGNYQVDYYPDGSPEELQSEYSNDTTVTLYGLLPNTVYVVNVMGSCGNLSLPRSFTFRTECTPLDTLPYVQNFESAETGSTTSAVFVPCLKRITNGTSRYPYVNTSHNHTAGGSKALLWDAGTTASTYGDYQYVVLPAVNTDENPMNTVQLRFWAKATSSSYTPVFQVGVMSDPSDISTFEFVQTVNVGANTAFSEFTVPFNSYEGDGQYVAIRALRPTAEWIAAVDDITLELMPLCPPVMDIVASTTVGSALLNWNYQDGFEAPSSYVITYGSISPTGDFNTVNATTNHVILTGLAPLTTYKAFIQADCGSEGMGMADSVEFTTGPKAVIDIVGTTESTVNYLPVGAYYNNSYTQQLVTAEELGNVAHTITGIDFEYAYTSPLTSKTNVNLYLVNTSDTLLSSAFVPFDTNFVLVYSGSLNCVQGWNHFDFSTPFHYDGTSNLLIVAHDNSGDYDGSSFVFRVHSATGKARYYQDDNTPFSLTSSSITSGSSSSYRSNMKLSCAVDVASLTCYAPEVMVLGATGTTVDLAWVPGYNEELWNVDYRVVGDSVWTSAATNVTSNGYTVTGLQDGTNYEFLVWFNCASDSAIYSGTASATTECLPKTLPYVQNFDGVSTSTTAADNYGVMPKCWNYEMTGSATYRTGSYLPGVYYSSAYAASGNYCLRLYGVGNIMLPEINAPLDSCRIRFCDTITAATSGLIVGVMEGDQFVPVDTVQLALRVRNNVEVKFDTYHGNSRIIALKNFHITDATTYSCYHYIDDMVVDYIPTCAHVENLTVTGATDSSISLSWTPVSTEQTWTILYDTASSLTVNTPFATITGLNADAVYTFDVYSNCSETDTSEAASISVRTKCSPLALPYSEDFESYGSGSLQPISSCWRKGTNNISTAYPYPAAVAAAGSRSLYFYAKRPAATASTPALYSYAALPEFEENANRLILYFKTRSYSTINNSYTSRVIIGVMSDPTNIATFEPMDTIDLHNEPASAIIEHEYSFGSYTGTGRHLAFYCDVPPLYGNGTSCENYIYIDDVRVDTIPNCFRPTDVTVSGIAQTSATVHWVDANDANGFEIEYGPKGFEHGRGTITTSSVDSVNLTGLIPSTYYEVYVRANCSATSHSNWSFVQNFATECGPMPLPMSIDPDNYTSSSAASALPYCWHRINNATGSSYNTYPYIYSSSSNAHTGTNVLYYYLPYSSSSSSYPTKEVIVFPEIDVENYPMNQNIVDFWAKSSVRNRKLYVGVMTDPSADSTFVAVDSVRLSTTVSNYVVSLAGYAGQGSYVALKAVRDTNSSFYIYVDDINIEVGRSCPRVYGLEADSVTYNSALLSWTDTIGSTTWKVRYAEDNSDNWTEVTATTNPFVLTGIAPTTIYKYTVAPVCFDGTVADWSRETVRFGTIQVPATFPYNYNFEDSTEWANWQTISNNGVNWYRGNAVGNPGYAMYLSADGGATQSWNLGAVTNAAAYRDIDFGTTPVGIQVSFDAQVGGSTDGNYDGITVMMVEPTGILTTSNSTLTSPWGHVSSVDARMDTIWSGESKLYDGVQGVKRLVFFWFNQNTASRHPYVNIPPAIDNISVVEQECERPYDLVASNVTDQSAMLSWHGSATDSFVVAHRAYASTPTSYSYDTVQGNSFLMTGLNENTEYGFRVRRICTLTATDTLVSSWSSTYRFFTEFGAYTLPYFENFDTVPGVQWSQRDGQLPYAWRAFSNGDSAKYLPHVTSSGSYWYSPDSSAALTLTSGSAAYGNTKIVALPPFNLPVSACAIKFNYKNESVAYGLLEIGYVTGSDLEGTFQPLVVVPNSSSMTMLDTTLLNDAPANASRIALRWTHSSSYYSVCIDNISVWEYRYPCTAPFIDTIIAGESSATVNFTGLATDYEVAIVEGEWVAPESGTPVSARTYTFSGLIPVTQYSIGIRSLCSDGDTSDWAVRTVTTLEPPCTPVSDVVASNETYTGVTVAWTVNGDETVWQVNVYSNTFDSIYTVSSNPVNLGGLIPGVTYSVKVRPMCGEYGNYPGAWNETPATFTTDICQPVTSVRVSNITYNSAVVTWNVTGTGSNSFEIEYGASGFNSGQGHTEVVQGTTYTITGLDDLSAYDVYVRAMCEEGVYSNWSERVSFTTLENQGIDDVTSGTIALYPNPASTTVNVTGIEAGCKVSVIDMNGRVVAEYKADGNAVSVDVTGMAQGAYYVRVVSDNTSAVRKLIVR